MVCNSSIPSKEHRVPIVPICEYTFLLGIIWCNVWKGIIPHWFLGGSQIWHITTSLWMLFYSHPDNFYACESICITYPWCVSKHNCQSLCICLICKWILVRVPPWCFSCFVICHFYVTPPKINDSWKVRQLKNFT